MEIISPKRPPEFRAARRWKEVHALCTDMGYCQDNKSWEQIHSELEKLYSSSIATELPEKFVGQLTREVWTGRPLCHQSCIKPILKRLSLEFAASEELSIALHRFGLDPHKEIQKLGGQRLKPWFIIRTTQVFPALSRLFVRSRTRSYYASLLGIPFMQLARYLPCFVLYRLEETMLNPQQVRWTRWMGNGNNIRKCPGFPFTLSKRMAHWFAQAPYRSTFENALLYGEIQAYGGSSKVFDILCKRYTTTKCDRSHWKEVIPFLVRNEAFLDREILDQVLGYLDHLREENLAPNLSRIQFGTLLRRVNAWYETLRTTNYDSATFPLAWPEARFRGYKEEGEHFDRQIVQLTTAKALEEESAYMKHCVYSYLPNCAAGKCSIWSFRKVYQEDDIIRVLTIQVDNIGRIVQVRGQYNAVAKAEEKDAIRQWAKEAGLQVVRF